MMLLSRVAADSQSVHSLYEIIGEEFFKKKDSFHSLWIISKLTAAFGLLFLLNAELCGNEFSEL